MNPSEFAAKWSGSERTERAAAQEHFIDLCRMLGVPTPNESDSKGDWYAFEKGAELSRRTLTNLYNERPAWLEQAHLALDRAVLAAYGWPESWAEGLRPVRDKKSVVNPAIGVHDPAVEDQLLAKLLALNQNLGLPGPRSGRGHTAT